MSVVALVIGLLVSQSVVVADTIFDTIDGSIHLSDTGYVTHVLYDDERILPPSDVPAFRLKIQSGEVLDPVNVALVKDTLVVEYSESWFLKLLIEVHRGFILFEIGDYNLPSDVSEIALFQLRLSPNGVLSETLNSWITDAATIGVMAVTPNVQAVSRPTISTEVNLTACEQSFMRTRHASKVGDYGLNYSAKCSAAGEGWVKNGRRFNETVDFSGLSSIKLWVRGDGKGELFKVQIVDNDGGYRDDYVKIDFTGWKQIVLTVPREDTLDYSRVRFLNLYFNRIPESESVSIEVDHIQVEFTSDSARKPIVVEDFEDSLSSVWGSYPGTLNAKLDSEYMYTPSRFALLVSSNELFLDTVRRFEKTAKIPSPEHNGKWLRQSSLVKDSYLFLSSFHPSEFKEVLTMAEKGGFNTILLHQHAWTESAGSYEVNLDVYKDGLEEFSKTIQKFKQSGLRVGLHILGAGVNYPDSYLTPVPDKRLLGATGLILNAAISETDDSVSVIGHGATDTVLKKSNGKYTLQVGSEILSCESALGVPISRFQDCARAEYGTSAQDHQIGDSIKVLNQTDGRFLIDLDTTLLDEVTDNFSRIANHLDIDMLYIDGAEGLQGEQWYYNSRLVNAFYEKLANKNTLVQASSTSHFAWHILSRHATADGHGDLKAYIDARTHRFDTPKRLGMPLDIGWYNGRDQNVTPDMFEYVLGATVAYDASLSFQTSVYHADSNLFSDPYLELIGRYEKIRKSGRIDEDVRDRLRSKANPHTGNKVTNATINSAERREYQLVVNGTDEEFHRVIYGPWRNIDRLDDQQNQWKINIAQDNSNVGFQIYTDSEDWLRAGPSWAAEDSIDLESFDTLTSFLRYPDGRGDLDTILNGESGSASNGVSQSLKLITDTLSPDGASYGLYSATNRAGGERGWSMMNKTFSAPVDMSFHGGIGMWMRGDDQGGKFKLQLNDGNKGAVDFYIHNSGKSWRYYQLPWPKKIDVNLSNVVSMKLFYNGIPENRTITVGLDGIRVISKIDKPKLSNPQFNISSSRFQLKRDLNTGEYVTLWPGERIVHYKKNGIRDNEELGDVPALSLSRGAHEVNFDTEGGMDSKIRVRLIKRLPESHKISPSR